MQSRGMPGELPLTATVAARIPIGSNPTVSSITRRSALVCLALVANALFASCGDDALVAPPVPKAHSLEVFPNPATVRVSEDLVMVAKLVADSGADRGLTWRSSDPRRVTISATGILTGVSVGPAVISVSSDANPELVSVVSVTVGPQYTGINSITISPASVTLIPGQTQGVSATVTADAGANRNVSYSSSSPNIATVSAQGLVTAVSVGSATITARSVVDTSVRTSVPITVRPVAPARVSIQAITSRGTGIPVDLQNVFGQVDVLINVEPGEGPLSRVDLVVTNNGRDTVVASQLFTASQSQALFAEAVNRHDARLADGSVSPAGDVAKLAAVIVQSFRSDAFNSTSGTVAFRNAQTSLRAVAIEGTVGGTTQQSASSSVAIRLNNLDGFLVEARPLSNTGIPSALDANGRRWVQAGRGLVITSTPVLFSGRQLGARVISYPGQAPIASATSTANGASVDTLIFPPGFVTAAVGDSYANGDIPSIVASDVTGNAIPLVPAIGNGSGAGIANVQPTFTSGTRLEGIRIDNAAPPAPTLVISTAQQNSNNWINGAYEFASGLSGLVPDVGVGLPASQNPPTVASSGITFQAVGGALTDTTQVTSGVQLPPSNTNTEYTLLARLADRLGNVRIVTLSGAGVHPGTRFGVDLLPPTLRYASGSLTGRTLVSTNSDSIFTSAVGSLGPRVFAVDAIDDRSGLPDGRVGISVVRFAQPNAPGSFRGTTTCVIGTGASCAPVLTAFESVLPDNFRQVSASIDGGTGVEGYYTFAATAQDQAGNVTAPSTKRALIDAGTGISAPFLTGLGPAGVLIGGQPAALIALATDNVELARGGVMIEYPNLPAPSRMLSYGTPLGGGTAIGTAFDTLLTSPIAGAHPAFTIPSFIRGLEVVDALDAPQAYPSFTAKPVSLNGWVSDFAFGGTPATLAANAALVSGSVQSPGAFTGFRDATGTQKELRFWRRVAGSSLQLEAIGPSGQVVSPFARVILVRLETSGLPVNPDVWRVIGEVVAPTGADNGIVRIWTYDFGGLSSGSYLGIGVTANGDAIATQVITL
ncbi:MAG: Ig-like domain-containing protein [Phycisphaerae bacterium]|nr:Ig-like domain-containing protein [Gemmatimonadaceae bacterium]